MADAISAHEVETEADGERRPRRRRRRPDRLPRPEDHRGRLRMTYFGLAAAWGFLIGSAAILGAVSFMNLPFRPDLTTAALLVVAALLAVAGGLVVARAYRDAVARRGR